MRFKVYGAKRDTGESTVVAVEASTEAEAAARANRHGLLVERCEPAPLRTDGQTARAPATPSPIASKASATTSGAELAPAKEKSSRMLARVGAAAGLMIIAGVAIYYFKIKPEHEAFQKSLADSVSQLDDAAKKQRDVDTAQIRRATIKAHLAATKSGSAFAHLVQQLDFTETAADFVKQAAELRDLTRGTSPSAADHARHLTSVEKAYAALKDEKFESSDRDFFDEYVQKAIAKYRDAQTALRSAAKRPELKAEYEATAASAWKEANDKLSSALFTYQDMVDQLEK